MNGNRKNKNILLNTAFAITCVGILAFLFNAPEETTSKLPLDDDHIQFQQMKKKEAEKFCTDCHNKDDLALPEKHPPKYRCLFCHKKQTVKK